MTLETLIAAVLDRAAGQAEKTLHAYAIEHGNTKTPAGRTAIFYGRKTKEAILSLSPAALAAELGHLVPGADEVERLRGELATLKAASLNLQRDMVQRAELGIDGISGEQYRIVNAGCTAWDMFCAALKGDTP